MHWQQVYIAVHEVSMKRGIQASRTAILCLFLIACIGENGVAQSAAHNSSAVQTIMIEPIWAGPDQPARAMITIRNEDGVFRRSWDAVALAPENNVFRISVDSVDVLNMQESDDHANTPPNTPKISEDVVSRDSVRRLLQVLQAPALRTPELSNLGITSAWLEQYADKAAKSERGMMRGGDERQQAFYRKSFTDLNLIERLLPQIIGASWTDDGVWVHVTMKFASGETWTAETQALTPFTLPWSCKVAGKRIRTYNADISRAVVALMPEKTMERYRISGEGFEESIRCPVESTIRTRWNEIGAEDQAGYALDVLRKRYTIRRSEVSEYNGLTFGTEPKYDLSQDASLQVDVFLATFPKNLTVAIVFPLRQGKAIGLETFLQKGSRYESLVLTNPWIMDSLRTHSDLGAWLHFDQDASFSEKAMRIFTADMQKLGRDDLVQQVAGHRDEVALLSYYDNKLILFPDHHAIVWRWDQSRELFKWPSSSLKTEECTDYNALDVGCVAAVIRPDGSLQK
jgi:hypothetical protein